MLRIKELEEEERALLVDIADLDVVSHENQTLHKRLLELVEQYEADKQRRDEEKETMMQKNFDIRMSMDQILRKTIRNFDTNYKEKAVRAYLLR